MKIAYEINITKQLNVFSSYDSKHPYPLNPTYNLPSLVDPIDLDISARLMRCIMKAFPIFVTYITQVRFEDIKIGVKGLHLNVHPTAHRLTPLQRLLHNILVIRHPTGF